MCLKAQKLEVKFGFHMKEEHVSIEGRGALTAQVIHQIFL